LDSAEEEEEEEEEEDEEETIVKSSVDGAVCDEETSQAIALFSPQN